MLTSKLINKKQKIRFYFIILFLFSISFNQYYGFIGINPIDSFFSFNAGFDILIGKFPFKDFWTITGPFIALTQALFFKIFGVSWFSYVFHASIFNFFFVISTFFTLYKLKLDINYCFLYSFLLSIVAYPSSGTPYVDHHSAYLSVISIYCFILAIKTKFKVYWFLLPIFLGISFLTKQAPTGHIFLIISLLSIYYFIFNFDLKKIVYCIIGALLTIFIFLIILSFGKISIISFFQQYILFPLSLGESRLDFLFPLEFQRIISRFKLIHLSYLMLVFVSAKKIIENYKYIKSDEFITTLSLIFTAYALIAHQLMTINGMYIFFIIPILVGFSHIFFWKYFKDKKYILPLLLFLSIASTSYYAYKYIHKRDFMDLRNANIENAVNAKTIDKKLNGLKWITPLYPEDPQKEILNLKQTISILKKDKRVKTIITDYQFLSVIMSIYDNSPSQVWFGYHVNPEKGSKYYKIYKNFLINKIKENKVEVVYVIKPLWGGNDIFEKVLNKNCILKNNINASLESYLLQECNELN